MTKSTIVHETQKVSKRWLNAAREFLRVLMHMNLYEAAQEERNTIGERSEVGNNAATFATRTLNLLPRFSVSILSSIVTNEKMER
jgi:hypothetical protein